MSLGVIVVCGAFFLVGCNSGAEGGTNEAMIDKYQKDLPPVDPNAVPQAPVREDGGGGLPGKKGP
ncbi:MAG TPA: hypothetical protein VK934_12365 [Fimbriimonas sp.]|nr:hypothetical protein [Fimbriimonas sp.]